MLLTKLVRAVEIPSLKKASQDQLSHRYIARSYCKKSIYVKGGLDNIMLLKNWLPIYTGKQSFRTTLSSNPVGQTLSIQPARSEVPNAQLLFLQTQQLQIA